MPPRIGECEEVDFALDAELARLRKLHEIATLRNRLADLEVNDISVCVGLGGSENSRLLYARRLLSESAALVMRSATVLTNNVGPVGLLHSRVRLDPFRGPL